MACFCSQQGLILGPQQAAVAGMGEVSSAEASSPCLMCAGHTEVAGESNFIEQKWTKPMETNLPSLM